MRIISPRALRDYARKHPSAAVPMRYWQDKTEQTDCSDFNELKKVFGSCDFIGDDRYIFNLGGNNYRLVAIIKFNKKCIYIRAVLSHAEYTAHRKNGTLITL